MRVRITLVLVAVLLAGAVHGAATAPAAAAAAGACSVAAAKADLAKRVAERKRAERREAEARYVLYQTRKYSSQYGAGVGRWVRSARRLGWPKAQLPTLFKVIHRESRGDYLAVSACGTYVGLLQFGSSWLTGATDWRTNPKESLRRCLKSVRENGSWVHWPTAY